MKFCLVAAILSLAPLVIADLAAPTARILYDSHGDFSISESYDARNLQYEYEGNLLIFQTQSNDSRGTKEFMHLRREQLKNRSFAIETYEEAGEKPDRFPCIEKSSESLRNLIDKCGAKIVLRELSKEESKQIQEFKDNQNGGKASFKLVYKKKNIQTRTVGLSSFQFREHKGAKDFTVFVNNYHTDFKYIRLIGTFTERSFVIEDLPVGRYKCRHTGLPDLKPVECNGLIKLRELYPEE